MSQTKKSSFIASVAFLFFVIIIIIIKITITNYCVLHPLNLQIWRSPRSLKTCYTNVFLFITEGIEIELNQWLVQLFTEKSKTTNWIIRWKTTAFYGYTYDTWYSGMVKISPNTFFYTTNSSKIILIILTVHYYISHFLIWYLLLNFILF